MGREIRIKTKRLILEPMSDLEIQRKIVLLMNADEAQTYSLMLQGSEQHKKYRLWYVPWRIKFRREDIEVGDIGFRGKPDRGKAELRFQTQIAYQGQGYMTEALNAMIRWAFDQKDVYCLEARIAPDNKAAQYVLTKAGFNADEADDNSIVFRKMKASSIWTSTYMCIGVGIGISLGSSYGNIPLGLAIGIGAGVLIGSVLDTQERKRRQEIINEKNT